MSVRARRAVLIVAFVSLISGMLAGFAFNAQPAAGGVERPINTPVATATAAAPKQPDLVLPVGTDAQRASQEWLPGKWYDANPYGNVYTARGNRCRHTGADINLKPVGEQPDEGKPVYAIADGYTYYVGELDTWGNVAIIGHRIDGKRYYVRYGHLADVMVKSVDEVTAGQQIGTIGRDEYGGPPHLHLDISPTTALKHNPADWPCMANSLYDNYLDPAEFYAEHWGK